jgi:aminoglycoside phosphotransferase family enzyme
MNRRFRDVNLQFDWALMEHDMSYTDVTDTAAIVREEYTTQSLHLNSLNTLLQKVHVAVMCQVSVAVFLLFPMKEHLVS